MKDFPFYTDVRGVILYHHENADGSGFFKKKAEGNAAYGADDSSGGPVGRFVQDS